jgi:hypothetical protein
MLSAAASKATATAALIRSFDRFARVERLVICILLDHADAGQSMLRAPVPSLMSIKLFPAPTDRLHKGAIERTPGRSRQ